MQKFIGFLFLVAFTSSACQNTTTTQTTESKPNYQNEAHALVAQAVEKVGTYDRLRQLKDVSYTYTYRSSSGKEDITKEQYIFDGELSRAEFTKRELTAAQQAGVLIQGFDGEKAWVSMDGEMMDDSVMNDRALFSRKTNFYWFAMNQKLLDPGLNYQYLRLDTVDNQTYDVVEVSFGQDIGQAQDRYHLYINQDTRLIDQFLFTVMAFERSEPLLMKVQYETVDGITLPTYRKYTPATWEGEILKADSWAEEISKDVQFNQGLKKEIFRGA
ncbi:MAG: hypothetical protein AAFO96_10530 [Bacteroidota bacterium]